MEHLLTAYQQLVVLFLTLLLSVEGGVHERRILEKFRTELSGFTKHERPAKLDDEPLEVQMGLTLQQIIDVDEKNQNIYTNMWVTMKWTDYKLTWDPLYYGNITQITIPYGVIWRPDILMYNSAGDSFDPSYQSAFRVSFRGEVEQIPPGMFKSSCEIKIRWFPFDDQVCSMKFGSWTYDGSKIDLRLLDGTEEGSLDGFSTNGEWHLMDFPARRNVITYECCPDAPFYDLTFEIHLRRRKLYYVVNIIAPCMLFSFLGLFTFTLPPEAGEKISFSVTVLLSLTVFMMIVSDILPPTSDAIPLIAVYFMGIMAITSGSIVSTIGCLNYHHRNSETNEMPRWVRVGIGEWLAWILRMERPGYEPIKVSSNEKSRWRTKKSQSDLKSLNNMTESIITNRSTVEAPDYFYNGFATSRGPNLQPIDLPQEERKDSSNHSNGRSSANLSSSAMARFELRAILRELRYITEQHREKANEAHTSSDWKWCAMVLDRFCIWTFAIINVVATIVIMTSAPNLFN